MDVGWSGVGCCGRDSGRSRRRIRTSVCGEHPWWGLRLGPRFIRCICRGRVTRAAAPVAWTVQGFDPRGGGQLAQLLHRHHLGGFAVLLRSTTPDSGRVTGTPCVRILRRRTAVVAVGTAVVAGIRMRPAGLGSSRSGARPVDEDLRRE